VLWVLNAYALVLAVLVITAGRLGDLIGPRTMFAAGIAVFTVASAACGFAPGPGWLIGFRAVQGIGAAMLIPQTLAHPGRALAAVSCLAIRNKAAGQDRPAVPGPQMAGTISSPGSSGQSPGSSSGTVS
jgi:MFS family permease